MTWDEVMTERVQVQVRDVPERDRYEAWAGDNLAGFLDYGRHGRTLVLIHTEVDDRFEGTGVGSQLVRAVLDQARDQGLLVNPRCPFVAAWIARHPAYLDVVPEQWRDGVEPAVD
jgi:predicted GNAT family acetyltransferase